MQRPRAGQIQVRRAGFTVVELCLGMLVTTMVMGAMAAMMLTVAQGWNQTQHTQSVDIKALQLQMRLQRLFQSARYVAQYQTGSLAGTATPAASIFFWAGDNFNGTSDGLIEAAEMALIQHDPTTGSVYLYQSMPISQMSAGQLLAAQATENFATVSAASAINTFINSPFVVKTTLAGPGANTLSPDNTQITGMRIDVQGLTSTAEKPIVEFQIAATRGSTTENIYASATLRAPSTQPG